MGRRLALIFKAKANKALDRAEDPRETLDYSYEKQLELLTKVRRGVADVATSRKRLEIQMQQLQTSADKLQGQAQQAVAAGRDDLAREALTRRAAANQQLADLQSQHANLQAEEEKLTLASQRLQAKVDAFRTRKETIKATYTAAEAQTKIGEAMSGISEEMGDVGMAMQRAEDKTQQMQARASAVDELIASGALDDASAPLGGRDDIQRELDSMSAGSSVELELAKLKGELPAGQQQQALPGSQTQPEKAPQEGS
ncbi:MAG TPA: PspA/IM30 family protein [Mycobacteriales bacterium]|nr:PspA/IM30 family protein [Mycobacteriales bacterium]